MNLTNRTKVWALIAIAMVIVMWLALNFSVFKNTPTSVSCNAVYHYENEGTDTLTSILAYHMSRGKGVATISGTLNSGGKAMKFNNRVTFTYTADGYTFMLKKSSSESLSGFPSINNSLQLSQYINPFYSGDANNHILNLARIPGKGWMFMSAGMPYFFCQDRHDISNQ